VLDPFEVYAQGDEILRQELTALDSSHLRALLRAYTLVEDDVDLDTLSRPVLAELIMGAVRKQVGRGKSGDGRRETGDTAEPSP
jgi:hypothetical protein